MKTAIEYLDQVRAHLGLTSDYQLARALQVTPSSISHLRKRHTSFDGRTALRVAELLGIDAAEVLTAAHAEREKRPEVRAVWERVAHKLAACVLLGLALVHPAPSQANELGRVCIMSTGRRNRLRALFAALLRLYPLIGAPG